MLPGRPICVKGGGALSLGGLLGLLFWVLAACCCILIFISSAMAAAAAVWFMPGNPAPAKESWLEACIAAWANWAGLEAQGYCTMGWPTKLPWVAPGKPAMPNRPNEAIGFCDRLATETAEADFLGDVDKDPGLAKTGGACNCWVNRLLAAAVEEVPGWVAAEFEGVAVFIPLNRSKTLLRLFLLTLARPEDVLLLLGLDTAKDGFNRLETGLGAILGKELPANWWVDMVGLLELLDTCCIEEPAVKGRVF